MRWATCDVCGKQLTRSTGKVTKLVSDGKVLGEIDVCQDHLAELLSLIENFKQGDDS